ncbi:Mut7-C RNAse domain-containing protein [Nocardiopsis salina]|uniref:Mut7-C RNAse domain-containing protein n=1 Tax=Nocardiopsis salina TaxID=245836 RepID=UPI00034B1E56|nr:Mut7-C RNAse domain-containing protein [Nocardiopsis salina]
MAAHPITLHIPPELRFFLPPRHREHRVRLPHDADATLGHTIQSLGIPLTEVGRLQAGDRALAPDHRPTPGATIDLHTHTWPQDAPTDPPRLLLDVHLGTLARRLRLLGVDTAYDNDRDDPSLLTQANAEQRILLTRDRGLLFRRALHTGAHVRAEHPDAQLDEVLARFAPPLHPWTRCPVCNGLLRPVAPEHVAHRLEPGTLATYDTFAQCTGCERLYWPGAHHENLREIVRRARTQTPDPP